MIAETDARKAGRALRRNSAQMGSYFFVTALILFSRNVVIARLIGPEEFGTASAIALLASMIEMGTGLGLDRLAIQARDGATPRMQASLQGMQALRGLAGALAMLLLAIPYALFLNVPAASATFAGLACVPLLRGLVHMDVFRTQRHGRFGSFIASNLISQLCVLLALLPLSHFLSDHRLMLVAVVAQQAGVTLMSHILARRVFRVELDPAIARRALSFGVPVLMNGLVLFITMNADQLTVGAVLGIETLGWFAVASTLTIMPSMVIAAALQSILLPALSRAAGRPAEGRKCFIALLWPVYAAAVYVGGVILIGPLIISYGFGQAYTQANDILVLLALAQAVRLCRVGPAILSIARGNTRAPLVANLPRLAMVPCAAMVLMATHDLHAILYIAIAGEALALGVACAQIARSERGIVFLGAFSRV